LRPPYFPDGARPAAERKQGRSSFPRCLARVCSSDDLPGDVAPRPRGPGSPGRSVLATRTSASSRDS
jgi:hypothetical protein